MEENKTVPSPNSCQCPGCMYRGYGGHRHYLLRLLLGLIILATVFAVGVKVGEFKATFMSEDSGFYRGDTMYSRHGMMQYRMEGYPLMNGQISSTTPSIMQK